MFSFAKSFFYTARLCFIYQIHSDSAMRGYKKFDTRQIDAFVLRRNAALKAADKYPETRKDAAFFIAFNFLSCYYYYKKSNPLKNDLKAIFARHAAVLDNVPLDAGKRPVNYIIYFFKLFRSVIFG
jgi:hypothetical protein